MIIFNNAEEDLPYPTMCSIPVNNLITPANATPSSLLMPVVVTRRRVIADHSLSMAHDLSGQPPSFQRIQDLQCRREGFTAKMGQQEYPPDSNFLLRQDVPVHPRRLKKHPGDRAASERGFLSDYTDFTSIVSW